MYMLYSMIRSSIFLRWRKKSQGHTNSSGEFRRLWPDLSLFLAKSIIKQVLLQGGPYMEARAPVLLSCNNTWLSVYIPPAGSFLFSLWNNSLCTKWPCFDVVALVITDEIGVHYEPRHAQRLLNVYVNFDHSNAHAVPLTEPRFLALWLRHGLFIVWVNSEGSSETAHLRSLTWTFAVHISHRLNFYIAARKNKQQKKATCIFTKTAHLAP